MRENERKNGEKIKNMKQTVNSRHFTPIYGRSSKYIQYDSHGQFAQFEYIKRGTDGIFP